jgi:putative exosortase-associated protein (TIGR04073 family)
MRTPLFLLSLLLTFTLLSAGCAGPEQKFGRGINNLFEIVRGGEVRRTVEQTAMTDGSDTAYTGGFVKGLNRSIARTFVGLYEVVTFPIPSYDPVLTHYLTPNSVYPDSYQPNLIADQVFAPDTSLGFAGGDVAPMIPGSRFRIFDN